MNNIYIDPQKTKMDWSIRPMRHMLLYFEDLYGKNELKKFVESTGMPLYYFDNENNWVSYEYNCDLLRALVEYTNDPLAPYKFSMASGAKYAKKSWGIITTILTSFASCTFAYKTIVILTNRYARAGKYELISLKRNKATIAFKIRDDLKQDKNDCLQTQGQFAMIPTYWNLPPAKIRETQCAAEGADSCIYELSWRNPPYKKTGLYFLLAGIIISVMLFFLEQHIVIASFLTLTLMFINIPTIVYSLWKLSDSKKILNNNLTKIDEQNETLTENLVDIEKLNETLQRRVEERTEELIKSNKEIEKNITDLKNNEDELIRSGKMALVGSLAEDIAGKLKKPVDKVKQNLKYAIEKSSGDDPCLDSFTGALRAADRCDKIINDLLSFSVENGNISLPEADVNKIIEDCVIRAREENVDPDIKILKELSNNLPKIKADYKQIEQVFMIMITNAHDAINEVRGKNSAREGKILIKSSLSNNDILVEISDTGCGMPKKVISKIFDPFFSTKTTSRRKGMGLTLSFNVIKRLGGRIEVESALNKGTRFAIYLPVEGKG